MSQVKPINSTIATFKHSNKAGSLRKRLWALLSHSMQPGWAELSPTHEQEAHQMSGPWQLGPIMISLWCQSIPQPSVMANWVGQEDPHSGLQLSVTGSEEKAWAYLPSCSTSQRGSRLRWVAWLPLMAKVISGPGLFLGPICEFLAWHSYGLHWCSWSVITT